MAAAAPASLMATTICAHRLSAQTTTIYSLLVRTCRGHTRRYLSHRLSAIQQPCAAAQSVIRDSCLTNFLHYHVMHVQCACTDVHDIDIDIMTMTLLLITLLTLTYILLTLTLTFIWHLRSESDECESEIWDLSFWVFGFETEQVLWLIEHCEIASFEIRAKNLTCIVHVCICEIRST